MEAANDYLDNEFLPDMNRRFTVPPREPHNVHRPIPSRTALDLALCWKEPRTVTKDWTIRWKNLRSKMIRLNGVVDDVKVVAIGALALSLEDADEQLVHALRAK